MFNLDQAISEWRRQMSAGGVNDPSVLDELESHVREDWERQTREGLDARKSFAVAVQRIGTASALRKEFKRSHASLLVEKLMIALASLVVAFGIFLGTVTLLLCYGTLAERFVGFIAMGLTLATACAWPAFASRLPVMRPKRKRWGAQVVSLALGFALCTLYVQTVVPHFEHGDGIVPSIGFFGIFFIAVGFGVAAGLDRVAHRAMNQMMA